MVLTILMVRAVFLKFFIFKIANQHLRPWTNYETDDVLHLKNLSLLNEAQFLSVYMCSKLTVISSVALVFELWTASV